MNLAYEHKLNYKNVLSLTSYLKTKLGQYLDKKEIEFLKIIEDIENSPEYQTLVKLDVFSRVVLIHSDPIRSAIEFNEKIFISSSGKNLRSDIYHKIKENQEIVSLIKKIGINNYQKYFLSTEVYSFDEITESLKISLGDVRRIFNFTNEVLIYSDLEKEYAEIDDKICKHYIKIARISFVNNKPLIIYFLPYIFRGEYRINYEKFYEFCSKLDKKEKNKYKNLIKNIELVNIKKNILHSTLLNLINLQKEYIITEDINRKRIITQKSLASSVGVSSSTICRILRDKSIEFPSGREYLLYNLVSNKKEIIINCLKNLLYNEEITDEDLGNMLGKKYGIKLARRTICYYRNLIKKKSY